MAGRVRQQVPASLVHRQVAQLAARLTRRVDEVADRMVAAYRVEIAPYSSIDEAQLVAEVRSVSRLNVEVILQCIAERRQLTDSELEALRNLGRRRSAQGFPLHALLRAYQVGTRVVWQELLAELRETVMPPELAATVVAQLSDTVLQMTAQVSGAVSQAYLEAEREAATIEERARRDVIEDLLAGEIESTEAIRRRASAVGFVLGSSHLVAVCGLDGGDGSQTGGPGLQSLAVAVREQLNSGKRRPIVANRGGLLVIVACWEDRTQGELRAAISPAARRARLPRGMRVVAGVGRVEPGIPGIHVSYRQALLALDVIRSAAGLPAVMTYDAALPYALLRRDPSLALDLVRVSVEPLAKHDAQHQTDLVRSLEAYLDCGGNLAEASKRLYVHRHTLYARIERIQELTGLKLSERDDLLLFELGLRAMRMLPEGVVGLSVRPLRAPRTPGLDIVSASPAPGPDEAALSARRHDA